MSDEPFFRYREAPQDIARAAIYPERVFNGAVGSLLGSASTARQAPAEDLLDTIAQLNARLELARQSGWSVELKLEAPPATLAHFRGAFEKPAGHEPRLRATLTRKV